MFFKEKRDDEYRPKISQKYVIHDWQEPSDFLPQ